MCIQIKYKKGSETRGLSLRPSHFWIKYSSGLLSVMELEATLLKKDLCKNKLITLFWRKVCQMLSTLEISIQTVPDQSETKEIVELAGHSLDLECWLTESAKELMERSIWSCPSRTWWTAV